MEHRFEWNDEKARMNLKKHDVDFQEASTIFDDPLFITFLDEEHSTDEERYITIGLSSKQRLLMVAHTEHGNKIRIISARKVTKNEENFYTEAR
ncbi:MAG: BrnT family toxin [Chloroflexi bacterium]|nr:BrnT family toxin [Chloroflexota bacterium]